MKVIWPYIMLPDVTERSKILHILALAPHPGSSLGCQVPEADSKNPSNGQCDDGEHHRGIATAAHPG